MADHHASTDGHPAMDYAEHDRTFALFIKMAKWGTIGTVLIVVAMALTLL